MTDASFARLRAQVARELEPVTPLKPPPVGALVTLPLAIFLLSVVLIGYGMRADAAVLGIWPVWGPATAMVIAAYTVLVVALRERTPGAGGSLVGWVALPLLALVVQLGGAAYTFRHVENAVSRPWAGPAVCFWHISLLGLPPVLVVLWLLSRGLTTRPRVAGLLGGLAGGMISEGVYRLHCGLSQPSHIIAWHTGAVLVMGVLGLLAGLWWERRRLEAWPLGTDA